MKLVSGPLSYNYFVKTNILFASKFLQLSWRFTNTSVGILYMLYKFLFIQLFMHLAILEWEAYNCKLIMASITDMLALLRSSFSNKYQTIKVHYYNDCPPDWPECMLEMQ